MNTKENMLHPGELLKHYLCISVEHQKALLLLAEGEDIISGLEAEADNAGIDLEEARQWWLSVENFFLDIKGEND